MRHIEQRSTVPPWQIVQILSQSKAADLGLAKEFISRFILKEQSLIAEKTKEMNLLRTETNNNVDELRQLKGGFDCLPHLPHSLLFHLTTLKHFSIDLIFVICIFKAFSGRLKPLGRKFFKQQNARDVRVGSIFPPFTFSAIIRSIYAVWVKTNPFVPNVRKKTPISRIG